MGCPTPPSAPIRNARSRNANIDPGSVTPDLVQARFIHMPGIFIHIPGIRIHILPESLFTSLRNPHPHAPEYAAATGD